MSKVFPDSEVLGWYIVTSSNTIGPREQSLHRQITALRAAIPLRPGSLEPAPAPELLTRALCDVPVLLHLNDLNVAAQRRVPLQVLVNEGEGGTLASHVAPLQSLGTGGCSVHSLRFPQYSLLSPPSMFT